MTASIHKIKILASTFFHIGHSPPACLLCSAIIHGSFHIPSYLLAVTIKYEILAHWLSSICCPAIWLKFGYMLMDLIVLLLLSIWLCHSNYQLHYVDGACCWQ